MLIFIARRTGVDQSLAHIAVKM